MKNTIVVDGVEFRLFNEDQDTVIVQHLESGDYLLEFDSVEECWEDEQNAAWVKYSLEEEDNTIEDLEAEFLSTVEVYTVEEILESVKDGYGWAQNLGLVVEVEDE